MQISFVKHYLDPKPNMLTIYLKNYKTSNTTVELLGHTKNNNDNKKNLYINRENRIIIFNIKQNTLHLLFKAISTFGHLKILLVHCKHLKYTLSDIIEYIQNVGYDNKIQKLIFVV